MHRRWTYLLISVILLSSCSQNNVTEDDRLGKFFSQAGDTGSFALFDNGKVHFTLYNLKRYRDSAYLPASTFKIVNSLIGIQTGVIRDEKMVIRWDSVRRQNEDWNRDLTMEEAFRVSSVPYYQEVARRLGRDTMKKWIDTLAYGNRDIGGPIDSFWLNNRLKITADEQLGLVKKLYFDQLPFFKRTQEIVKKVMLQESNANYLLSYKTGKGESENGHGIFWVVGWVEENHHPYFFVLNTESTDSRKNMRSEGLDMLKKILSSLGFLQGKQ